MSDLLDLGIEGAASALLGRTYLIQTKTPSGIPTILCVFDIITSEEPVYEADITQHAVESGTEVTDHIQLKNPTLKLSGAISNTPLDLSVTIGNLAASAQSLLSSPATFTANALSSGATAAAGVLGATVLGKSGGGFGNVLKAATAPDSLARTALISAYENKSIFDVVTKRQRYPSMAIASLSFPRDNTTGYQCVFEMDMVRIRIVDTSSVTLASVTEKVKTSAVTPTNLGSQVTKAVSSAITSATSIVPKVFGGR